MIIGASGGVGTFAVQIARAFEARLTGVCGTRNFELVRSIGANHVIDYTRDDFTRTAEKYELIFQLAGTHSASALRRVLTSDGTLVLSSGGSANRVIGSLDGVGKAVLLSRSSARTSAHSWRNQVRKI